MDMILKNW